jgi:putative ABC transport system permease protein
MVIGLLGGLLGLALTAVGLSALRGLRGITSADSARGHLASLNVEIVLITFGIAILATICSGLYPALRASRVQPAWQLKAQ